MRIRALMLIVIAHAVILTGYITSYQHVYSQSQSLALYLGATDPAVIDILNDEGYIVLQTQDLPEDLSAYNLLIVAGSQVLPTGVEDINAYLENGGGLVYLSGAAESLDLAANHDWIGAQSVGFSGLGENATSSINSPLGSNLVTGDILMQQAADQSGALWVSNLEPGAVQLAQYSSGNTFAYSYEAGDARVYFQAGTDAGIGNATADDNIRELLKAGIIWATSEVELQDLLPVGTEITNGNEQPAGSLDILFSESGPQSHDLSDASAVHSIFVASDSGVINPRLFFEAEGQEFYYHLRADSDSLLTFPLNLDITSARLEVDAWLGGNATVGYVTISSPPLCNLPARTVTNPDSIPEDAIQVDSTNLPVGSSLALLSPPVPIDSIFVGFGQKVNGYVLGFEADGQSYQCPVGQQELVEIAFDEPIFVSDAELQNEGPWSIVDIVNPDDVPIYAKFAATREFNLPAGSRIEPDSAPPIGAQPISFSDAGNEISPLTGPEGRVVALWVSSGSGLSEPYLYFRAGGEWYSTEIDQQINGSLLFFPSIIDIDEVYASATSTQGGSITIGYAYPITVKARAGSDQTVEEKQIVYLDGRSSAGQGAISFKWTQTEGPDVVLRDLNTATPFFGAPEVGELGARIAFRLVVTDAEGKQSADLIVVLIKNDNGTSNHPPQIGALDDAFVDEGAQVVLSASAFDSDGDTLAYSWTQKTGPSAGLSGGNTASISFQAPEVAATTVLTFQVSVSDDRGKGTTKDVRVTVRNITDEIPTIQTPPAVSAGNDQAVVEGSSVVLNGTYTTGPITGYELRWVQVSGDDVTLNGISSLNASFVAPQIDANSTSLILRLGVFNSEGIITRWDDVSIAVNNRAEQTDNSVKIEEDRPGPTSLGVGEPAFSPISRVDAAPPAEIYSLAILGPEGASSPTPSAPIVGIWINTTSNIPDLKLHFSSAGRNFWFFAASNAATAYVFDRSVSLQDIRVNASSNVQMLEVGYYYDQVELTSVPSSTIQEVSPPVQAKPPAEGAIIKFARENQMIAGLMAIAVPLGIGVGLKLISTRRRKFRLNPARALFPKNDPVAGEAEKVRPVIEELEKMLGRNLDTALSASELLDKFGSGSRSEAPRA